jgi:hypothetical protein
MSPVLLEKGTKQNWDIFIFASASLIILILSLSTKAATQSVLGSFKFFRIAVNNVSFS